MLPRYHFRSICRGISSPGPIRPPRCKRRTVALLLIQRVHSRAPGGIRQGRRRLLPPAEGSLEAGMPGLLDPFIAMWVL